jgi:hypothetical protein
MGSTFGACGNGWDWQADLFNYGWSSIDMYDGTVLVGFVCAATGTTNWLLDGTNYSVPEATYRTYSWQGWDSLFDNDFHAQANNPVDMHLHTQCGGEYYDEF